MLLARLYNDFELAEMGYKSRIAGENWKGLPSTPQTVPLKIGTVRNGRVVLHGKETIRLTEYQNRLVRRINNDRAYHYITTPIAGWMIHGEGKAESIGFGDNIVEVLHVIGEHAQIKTLPPGFILPDDTSPSDYPELFHRMTVVTRKNTLIKPGKGLDVFIFLTSTRPVYIPVRYLDFNNLKPIPQPNPDTDRYVISKFPLAFVHKSSGVNSPVTGVKLYGDVVHILHVTEKWGMLERNKWIKLDEMRIL